MATSNRGGNRRSRPNNNSEGRNQFSASPLTAAVTVGGAVAAGLFLWARRNQITEQINDWREGRNLDTGFADTTSTQNSGRTQAEIAEEALTLKQTGSTA